MYNVLRQPLVFNKFGLALRRIRQIPSTSFSGFGSKLRTPDDEYVHLQNPNTSGELYRPH